LNTMLDLYRHSVGESQNASNQSQSTLHSPWHALLMPEGIMNRYAESACVAFALVVGSVHRSWEPQGCKFNIQYVLCGLLSRDLRMGCAVRLCVHVIIICHYLQHPSSNGWHKHLSLHSSLHHTHDKFTFKLCKTPCVHTWS
jgi:hypothetical protein